MSVTWENRSCPCRTANPTGSAASCGVGKMSTTIFASFKLRLAFKRSHSTFLYFGAVRSLRRWKVPSVAKSGVRCLRAKANAARAWSWCSWESNRAVIVLGGTPKVASRLSISRQVSPASMRRFAEPLETNVTLPLLPLPRTDICRAMGDLRQQYTDRGPGTVDF